MSLKLTPLDAEWIRLYAEFGFSKRALSKEYGVHVDTVRNILNGTSFNGDPKKRVQPRKLTDEQVRFIREEMKKGSKEQAIARMLQGVVGRSTVRQVMEGKSYQDVT